jgi:glucoamylase
MSFLMIQDFGVFVIKKNFIFIFLVLSSIQSSMGDSCSNSYKLFAHNNETIELGNWMEKQEKHSYELLKKNVKSNGAVAAAGGVKNVEYPDSWVRDTAHVMGWYMKLLEKAEGEDKKDILKILKSYTKFCKQNQETPTVVTDELGKIKYHNGDMKNPVKDINFSEPKFRLNGESVDEEWGRPQRDGPALRSFVMSKFAQYLHANQSDSIVKEVFDNKPQEFIKFIYNPDGFSSVAKADLEHISHSLTENSFDVWEEAKGNHFYTQAHQRQALLEGADLAEVGQAKDNATSTFYRKKAHELDKELEEYWDGEKGILKVTRNQVSGVAKSDNMDTSVVIGVMQTQDNNPYYKLADSKVISTVNKTEEEFRGLYPANHKLAQSNKYHKACLMGRYKDDTFCGIPGAPGGNRGKGNPWILITNYYAGYHYGLAESLVQSEKVIIDSINLNFFKDLNLSKNIAPGMTINKRDPLFKEIIGKIFNKGEGYVKIIKDATPESGLQSEQISRDALNVMDGAEDLSWNAESFLVTKAARDKFIRLHFLDAIPQ